MMYKIKQQKSYVFGFSISDLRYCSVSFRINKYFARLTNKREYKKYRQKFY